jgi:GNAT superfamily N-acetyltransferase
MRVTIRPMHVGDISAGLRLCRLSGWNQGEEDWRLFLCESNGGGRVAEYNGAIVGTVTFLRYGDRFSWLSMMLVHPDARRAGIGRQLMAAALDALAGETCVRLDATPLGEPLYREFGFQSEFELLRMKATTPARGLEPVSGSARPIGQSDLGDVFALDREVFGADRSELLASFHSRAPDLAWSVRRRKTLLGYCFGRPGHLYRQLGPIVADNTAVAGDLVARCLVVQPGLQLALDAPSQPPEWITRLQSLGFAGERPFLRMYRGDLPSPGTISRQFAISGPEFG